MERDEVLAIIGKHQKVLEELGVKSLDLFGSVARNKANAKSER